MKNGKIVDRYLWGARQDELLCENDHFMMADHLGTVRKVVDRNGSVVSSLKYNAFGKIISCKGTLPRFRYTGKMFDDDTGLQWNVNRWYDPNVGRWASEDPIGFKSKDVNLCRYVNNEVTCRIDLLGLWKSDVHYTMTRNWCYVAAGTTRGFKTVACTAIAEADNGTDGIYLGPWPAIIPGIGDQSYHFNRNFLAGGDSRVDNKNNRFAEARNECSKFPTSSRNPEIAAAHLGVGLHAIQDYYAHGDYGRLEWPDINIKHNYYGTTLPGAASIVSDYPDDPALDASGDPTGRPAGAAILTTYVFVAVPYAEFRDVDYADYIFGTKRITATENRTKNELLEFYNFLASRSSLCECRQYFTFL